HAERGVYQKVVGGGVGAMKNTKHQTPNTREPPNTKLQYPSPIQGRFKNGVARTALSACVSRPCSRRCLNPSWACLACLGVCDLGFLWSLVFGVRCLTIA